MIWYDSSSKWIVQFTSINQPTSQYGLDILDVCVWRPFEIVSNQSFQWFGDALIWAPLRGILYPIWPSHSGGSGFYMVLHPPSQTKCFWPRILGINMCRKNRETLPWCCKKISHPKNFHHADQPSANAHLEFAPRFSQRRSKGIEVIVVTSIILASEHRLHRLHLEMPRRHSPFAAKRLFEDVWKKKQTHMNYTWICLPCDRFGFSIYSSGFY